jgi:hypothetical protein
LAPAPSPGSGGFGGGCFESWNCGAWSACDNGVQTRRCNDLKGCGTTLLKPHETLSCAECVENWACTDWGACSADGKRIRFCTDQSRCGTEELKPVESESCAAPEIVLPPAGAAIAAKSAPNTRFAAPAILLVILLISVAILSRSEYHGRLQRIVLNVLHVLLALTVVFFAAMMFLERKITGLAAITARTGTITGIGIAIAAIAAIALFILLRHHKASKLWHQHHRNIGGHEPAKPQEHQPHHAAHAPQHPDAHKQHPHGPPLPGQHHPQHGKHGGGHGGQ